MRAINWDNKWVRLLIHIPHGVGISSLLMLHPIIGGAWFGLCLFYQLIEDWRIRDNSYLDLRGYMVGFWIPLILRLLL